MCLWVIFSYNIFIFNLYHQIHNLEEREIFKGIAESLQHEPTLLVNS